MNCTISRKQYILTTIGEALDLARLDGRVTDLITAFNTAF